MDQLASVRQGRAQSVQCASSPAVHTEVLDEIFTWQETRKLSHSLTFNYQRQLFLLPDTEETRLLAGQRVTVVELSDGTVQTWHGVMAVLSAEDRLASIEPPGEPGERNPEDQAAHRGERRTTLPGGRFSRR